MLYLNSVSFFQAEYQPRQRSSVKGNEGIEVTALSVDSLVCGDEQDYKKYAGHKSPGAKQCCEEKKKHPHKLKRISQLIGGLGKVCNRYESHIQNYV